ncbi:F5/8 type C domain-containing protein [Streptomyces sp. 136MFCol5.1]|uniref:galactose-binding domain-containing protein n=1 Tax=Streptomyces sp. 136MFCol5.1 TaxID=1172182 RepID=UPI0008845330|nr:discoidin domain-containing protein [Streptomyces sp. 136MFCol5.1]SCZ01185.1 F5/8 type C domain-containing protein [Streptomyces sp. 136MFCol5.1]
MTPPPKRLLLRRSLSASLSLALAAFGTAAAVVLSSAPPARAAGVPAPSPLAVPGRGATVPFKEQEAEYAATNGTLIGPNRLYGTLPSEASGRQAVTLDAVGEYVEFTLTAPANAMSFRYSLPDSPDGTGRDASIDVRVSGGAPKSVPVTSKYGWYYGGYPFNNNPGDTNPHHFYDEARTMFGSTLPIGTKVRLQVSSTAASPTFTIDLADFEQVDAPVGRPSGALDVVGDFGADPTGATDSTGRIQAAVDAGRAQGKEVYIPQGTFQVRDHIVVDKVTLRGAGPWYSVLTGRDPSNRSKAVGVYGKYAADGGSSNVTLKDFAIIGDIRERVDNDQVNAIGGAMSNSVVDNIWMQHTKCGAWMDGPMDNFTVKNSRILDQTADGVNFHYGVTNSTVTNTFVRNTGDDGLAMWAENVPNVKNKFTFNTVILPILANNIVTYGGKDITISDNVMSDTITNGGGLHVANRYPGVNSGQGTAVSGITTAARNTLIRTGNNDFNWRFGVGAIWFSGLNEPINATINITDTEVLDSSYAAIHLIEGATNGLHFDNVRIDGAGTYALQIQAPGTATFTDVVATHIAQSNPIHNCVGSGFQITRGSGNSGWYADPPACTGTWPDPVWTNGGVPGGGTDPTDPTDPPTDPPSDPGNLALGRPVTESGHADVYGAANAVDGNASSYWESTNHAFPQSITVDLGAPRAVKRVVLKLPPATAWATRTQTLSVSGSADNSSYSSLKGSADYVFDPAHGNTATVTLPGTSARYLRLTFTANTGWPAGQLSELEAYTS